MIRTVQFIVNPVSGRARHDLMIAELARVLQRHGVRTRCFRSPAAGEPERFARSLNSDVDAVLVVGGDGTISEVLDGLSDHPRPIALCPTGTENLLAKLLGLRAELRCLFATLMAGEVHAMDLGRTPDTRHLAMVAGAGFDASVVHRMAACRRGHISYLDYFWPLWRTFWEYRFPPIRVRADGAEVFAGRGLPFVANIPRYAWGLPICKHARLDDGLLDVCVFDCAWQGRLLSHAVVTSMGRHLGRRGVHYRQARVIEIDAGAPLPLQIDGDPAGTTPIRFEVRPAKALILLPPRPTRGGRYEVRRRAPEADARQRSAEPRFGRQGVRKHECHE